MKIKIWSALIVVYIVWGATYLAIFFAVENLPPFILGGIRYAIAGVLLYVWRRFAGDPKPSKIEWKSAAIAGLFLLVGGNGGVTWAEQYVVSSIAALIIASVPLWIVLINWLKSGRGIIQFKEIAGILIGFAGILLLIGRPELNGSPNDFRFIGMIVLLFAAFTWAFGSVFIRDAILPSSILMSTSMFMLTGSAGLILIGTLTGEWSQLNFAGVTNRSWTALAYLILFGSLIGFAAYSWLLRNAPINLVATYAYVNPVVAVLLGAMIAGEPLNIRIITATMIIILAVMLTSTGKPEAEEPVKESVVTPIGND